MKKVLIVSYFFPPLNIIAAKRYGTMSKYFIKNGYEPYVLTTTVKEGMHLDSKRDLQIPISRKNIIRIGKKSDFNSFRVKAAFSFFKLQYKFKLQFRALMGQDDWLWYQNVKEKIVLEKLKDIDIIIGTFGPISNIYIARYLAQKLGCPYIADIRDLISEWEEVLEGNRHWYIADNIIEKKLLSSAAGIVAVTKSFKRLYQKKYPTKKVAVVFNGWDFTQDKITQKTDEKYLYYAGSLYEHRMESLFLLLKVLKKVNEKELVRLIIRSIGPKELDNRVKEMIFDMEMENYVSILPPKSENEIRDEQSGAYINVVLGSIHEEKFDQMATVPGKIYELMNMTAPILALTSNHSDIAHILSYTNKGLATISDEQIMNFILYNHAKFIGNKNILMFSREYQAAKLCRFMDYLLK